MTTVSVLPSAPKSTAFEAFKKRQMLSIKHNKAIEIEKRPQLVDGLKFVSEKSVNSRELKKLETTSMNFGY